MKKTKNSRESIKIDPELRNKKIILNKIHSRIKKTKLKITRLRNEINSIIVDPRAECVEESLRKIN